MKVSIFQFVLSLLFVSLCGAKPSEAQDILNKTVSIRAVNREIHQVLSELRKKADIRFTYSSNVIQANQKVTLLASDQRLSEVMEKLLKPLNIEYRIEGKQIILYKSNLSGSLAPDSQTANPIPLFTVKGRITDQSGIGLPGANVLVKGTTNGTSTDPEGNYSIVLPSGNEVLVFSYIGYITQEVPVGNQTTIDVKLQSDDKTLGEIVVVGYGTQRRQDVTGAISTIKADDIRTQGSNSIQKTLQGRVAGVQVESAGGNPGSGVRILIRGTGSLNNNNPLYIVDGLQVDNINNLSPSDIASLDILKDASAAAIYGSRAANGVVLVTTKSGKKGPARIDFDAYYGVQNIAKKLDLLNASQWATISNRAYATAGLTPLDIAKNPEQLGNGTDWQKEIYQAAPIQNYSLSASGGGDNFNYSVSGGYLGQNGIVKKSDYQRMNLRMKSDFTKGRVKVGESVIFTREYFRTMAGGWGGQGGNPVGSAAKMIPVFNIYDSTAVGGYAGAYGPVNNVASPVAQLNLEVPKNYSTNVLFNAFAEISLIKGLKYKFNVGYTTNFGYNYVYTFPYKVGALFVNQDADLSESRSETNYFLQEHTLNYEKALGKHRFEALAGFTYQNTKYRNLNGSKSGMPAGITVLDGGFTNIATGSNASQNALASYLGRLVYSYNDKYVLTGTFRRDGSSRFSKDNKYGNFPSIALAWNVSNESFFKPVEKVITNMKLRASYGILGNQEIADYRYIASITSNANYVIGQSQLLWPGAIQSAFATSNIKWETSKTFDIGTDLSFFQNKLSLTADYFNRKNSDILLQVPIPLSTGASGNPPYINSGEISNKGWEAAVSFNNTAGDFTYQLTGTITAVKNEVNKLGTGSQQIFGGTPTHNGASSTVTQAGIPVGAFYLIKTNGIFNSEDEISAHAKDGVPIQPAAKPGDIRFVDYNNDGKIDQSDRQNVGNPTPKFSYGFGGNVSFKGIDASIYFQGTKGNDIYNGLRQDLESMNTNINYMSSTLDAWTPERHTNFPRAVINDPNANAQTSERYLEDGSYLRMKTLQIGYSLPKRLSDAAKLGKCRIYASFDNVFTITKYKGYNPDLGRGGSILDRGVDFGHVAYPLAKTAMLGLQLSF